MNRLWAHCLQHFERELPAQQFRTWIQPLSAASEGQTLTITAPNRFVLQWVKDRFLPVIEQLAREAITDRVDIILQLADHLQPSTIIPSGLVAPAITTEPAKLKVRDHSRLNPSFTFDSFVTGKANQLARAAAIQVAGHPRTAYNPLFIYGGVGLGKTHLIQASGNLAQEHNPPAKVRYIHAEQYVSDVVRAYQ